jgi:hypothetical protein
MHFTKIEVAEIQLRIAIRMLFCEEHPVAIETLVGAASGVLRDLAKQRGFGSILHDNVLVNPEHKSEWIELFHKPQNFAKHADRDPQGICDYQPRVLHYLLLETCQLYRQLASDDHLEHRQIKEALMYEIWFSLKYPHLLCDPDAPRKIVNSTMLQEFNPDDFEVVRKALGIECLMTQ